MSGTFVYVSRWGTAPSDVHSASLQSSVVQKLTDFSRRVVQSQSSEPAGGRVSRADSADNMQNDDLNSQSVTVQVTPLPSVPTQLQFNIGWQSDRDNGLRSLRQSKGPARGPIAMRSFRDKLFFVDAADRRVVHLSSDGKIIESIALPVDNPQKFQFIDDGSMVVWDPNSPDTFYRSLGVLGELQLENSTYQWQKLTLPVASHHVSTNNVPVSPTHFFQFNGSLFVGYDYGSAYRLNQDALTEVKVLAGRPTAQSEIFVSANFVNSDVIVSAWNSQANLLWERRLQTSGSDVKILAVESSHDHNFVVVAWEATEQNQRVTLCAKIDTQGQVTSVLELGQTLFDGYEVQDPIAVDHKNSFLHMIVRSSGLTVERHAWK